jgi:hypothetical protein
MPSPSSDLRESPGCGPIAVPLLPTPSPAHDCGQVIPLWTASAPPPTSPISGRSTCDYANVGGYLHRHAESGLGLGDRRGRRVSPVIWLFGSTARETPDGIVLIGPGGSVPAREGDRIVAAGGTNVEGVTYICSP